MATAAAAYPAQDVALYPVQLLEPPNDSLNRLWGIPIIGMWVRALLIIPHALVLAVLVAGLYVVMLVGWIPILLFGRVPDLQQTWIKEYLHRYARTYGYVLLLPGGYPPLEPGMPGPVDVRFQLEGRTINRLWGIPIFGVVARMIALIPHVIVMMLLATIAGLTILVVWIPILINGRYPRVAMEIVGGTLRYGARVLAYALLLPVPYPPFSLEN